MPCFPYVSPITAVLTKVTRRVSHVEQKLPTFTEHTSSALVFRGVNVARSLIFFGSLLFRTSLFVLFLLAIALCVLRYTTLITILVAANKGLKL